MRIQAKTLILALMGLMMMVALGFVAAQPPGGDSGASPAFVDVAGT